MAATVSTTRIYSRSGVSPQKVVLTPIDNIMPKTYTRFLLAYPISEGAATFASRLRDTLPDLLDLFPDLLGVIHMNPLTGAQTLIIEGDSVDFVEASYPELDFPTLSSYPPHFAPVPAFASGEHQVALIVQFNILKGGLVLCVAAHHAVCDGPGLAALIGTWSAIAREERIPRLPSEVNDRSQLLRGVSSDTTQVSHPEYKFVDKSVSLKPRLDSPPTSFLMPKCQAKIFKVDIKKLGQVGSSNGIRLSKNDVLMALIWRAVTRSRHQAGFIPSDLEQSMFGMATNGRNRLDPPLPKQYIGNVNFYCPTIASVSDLLSSERGSLSKVAKAIHQAVEAMSDSRLKSALRWLSSPPVSENIKYVLPGWKGFLGTDWTGTSWQHMFDDMELETTFGEQWGGAIYARVPDAEFDGLAIVLPARRDAQFFEVFLGLRVEAMEYFERDIEWAEFAL